MTNALRLHREAEAKLQALAAHIKSELPKGIVFLLITGTVGEGGYSAYVSNGDRDCNIELMKEHIARLESATISGPFAEIEELAGRKNRHDRRKTARGRRP